MNLAPPPPLKSSQAGKPVLTPMVLSALVCPGAGQLMQRRWLAGGCYMVMALGATAWLLKNIFCVLKAYYGLAFDSLNAPADSPGITMVVLPFAVWLVIYVAGIVDTAIAGYRQQVNQAKGHR